MHRVPHNYKKRISKHMRNDILRCDSASRVTLCALCTRMHKEWANESDVRSDKMLIFGLRRCFMTLCVVHGATSQREKKIAQQGFQTADFEFQTCYRVRRSFPTRR